MIIKLFHKASQADISRLVEQFLAGATSLAQERRLYRYYAAHRSLPAELEQYRPMFQWYAAMEKPGRRFTVRRCVAAAVVAVLIAGAAIGFAKLKNSDDNELYTCYKGSYIVRDGKKIDDVKLIYSTICAAELYADSLEAQAERKALEIERIPDEIMMYDLMIENNN